jgi:hypothetical protein
MTDGRVREGDDTRRRLPPKSDGFMSKVGEENDVMPQRFDSKRVWMHSNAFGTHKRVQMHLGI